MTEEEAKTKWCPMTFNTPSGEVCRCIASDCMMWVKEDQSINDIERWGRQGRCGLAK